MGFHIKHGLGTTAVVLGLAAAALLAGSPAHAHPGHPADLGVTSASRVAGAPRPVAEPDPFAGASGAAGLRASGQPGAMAMSGSTLCPVDFDRHDILAALPQEAENTFAPGWVQRCGPGKLRVEPLRYGHYHLGYQDPTIDCTDLMTGLFGRGEVGDCDPLADPAAEPRFLMSHIGNEVVRIRLRDSDGHSRAFGIHRFSNVRPEPVKVSFRNPDGAWFQWDSLAGNTIWDVSAHLELAEEVLVTHADSSLSCGPGWVSAGGGCGYALPPFALDDIVAVPGVSLPDGPDGLAG